MDYILNTLLPQYLCIPSEHTTEHQTTAIDDVDMFLLGLPSAIGNTKPAAALSQQTIRQEPQTEEEAVDVHREVSHGTNSFDVETHEKESDYNWNIRDDFEERDYVYYMPEDSYRSYEPGYWKDEVDDATGDHEQERKNESQCQGFHVNSDDNHSSYSWNIRDDYEERYHVYKMPSDTYRSYEPGYWKNEADEKKDDHKREIKDESQCQGFDVQSDDNHSSYSWNIRDDYEERYHVYKMPSDTYRSYDLGYWKNDERANDGARDVSGECKDKASDTEMESTESLNSENESEDLKTKKTKNVPHASDDNINGRPCKACGMLYDAEAGKVASQKKPVFKRMLFWRKKNNIPRAQCGCRVDRKSVLKRIFGGKKSRAT